MNKFLDEISNEKFNKMMEINEKYERDLGNVFPDVEPKDLNNINTIVYNQLKDDKQNDINELNANIELRKMLGLNALREKSDNLKNLKNKELEEMKISFTTQMKEHFKSAITPKEVTKFEFSSENALKDNMIQNGSTIINKTNDELVVESKDKVDSFFQKKKFEPKPLSNAKHNSIKTVPNNNNNNRKVSTGSISQLPDKRKSTIK